MLKKAMLLAVVAVMAMTAFSSPTQAAPPQQNGQPANWQRFYHYPYVYYPQNFQKPQQYNSMYYKYSPSMRIPVYNKNWYNFYPSEKAYHSGHHFILDVF